jgi:hypothetical protein
LTSDAYGRTGPTGSYRAPPPSQDPDNDLDDEHPIDEDECFDIADQEPLPSPTLTGVLGPIAQFLLDMSDFMEGVKESLQRALQFDALAVSTPGPPPHGISIHEAIW